MSNQVNSVNYGQKIIVDPQATQKPSDSLAKRNLNWLMSTETGISGLINRYIIKPLTEHFFKPLFKESFKTAESLLSYAPACVQEFVKPEKVDETKLFESPLGLSIAFSDAVQEGDMDTAFKFLTALEVLNATESAKTAYAAFNSTEAVSAMKTKIVAYRNALITASSTPDITDIIAKLQGPSNRGAASA